MSYFDNEGNELEDWELKERFKEYLDEAYPEVTIGEISFSPSTVLQECDPIAFRVYLSDWIDSELDETLFEEDPTADPD